MPILRLQGNKERVEGIYYEVDSDSKPIGVGGMGTVYKGRQVDEQTGVTREVAIKFLFEDLSARTVEKARREASIQLHNSNLVEMLGFIETETPSVLGYSHKRYHVVSELLHGVSLSDVMKGKTCDFEGYEVPFAVEKQREYEANPLEFARSVVYQVLLGLIALHNAGYIHRDIDPSNIMLTSDGKVKLIDFGIAKQMGTLTQTDASRTQEGALIGKAEYAPPELVEGRVKEQDQRSDIYAMGMLLYTCIVGHPPFPVGSPYGYDFADVLKKQVNAKVPMRLIRNLDMRKIIRKATQKKRQHRYQSTAEMMVALEQLPQPLMREKFPYDWKKPVAALAIAVVVASAVLGARLLIPDKLVGYGEEIQTSIPLTPLEEAVEMLVNDSTAANVGLKKLDSLSKAGNGEAKFLLSRLYFNPKGDPFMPAYIRKMREHVKIEPNNVLAHKLLEEAIKKNDCTNIFAYYAYALDFRQGDELCKEYEEYRDKKYLPEAKEYFEKARNGAKAKKSNDEMANSIYDKATEGLRGVIKEMAKKKVNLLTEKERDDYLNNILKNE